MDDVIEQIKRQDLKIYLEKLGHVLKGNMTLCPFHDDTVPSMSIDLKDGSWVWYCHPCETGGNIIHYVMKKYSLKKGEAIKKLATHFNIEVPPAKPKVIAEYSYTDEQDKRLYRILRYKPKTFKADRKMNGIRQVLYKLPEVMKADKIWLVEGEKDAGNVRKLGLVATTSPFGIVNWKPEFSSSLKGKNVRICLDVGTEKEAEKRAVSILEAGAAEVKIIELPDLERKGEDVSDWIERHDSQSDEDLKNILNKIASETVAFKPQDEDKTAISVEELSILQIPEINWLVHPILERHGFTILGGMKGIGKSLLITQLALYLAAGKTPFISDEITIKEPAKVLLVQQEVSLSGMQNRFFKMRQEQAFNLEGRFLQKTTTGEQWDLTKHQDYQRLINLIKKHRSDLLILDPLYTFHRGGLNTDKDAAPILKIIQEIKANYNLGIVLVHHFSNKEDPDSIRPSVGRFMGSSNIANAADVTIALDFLHPKYRQSSLPLPYQNYITVEITTRHGEWPQKFSLERDSGCLLFQKSTIWQDIGRSLIPGQIEEVIEANDGEMMQKDVIKFLLSEAKPTTVRRAIDEAVKRGAITKEKLLGKGNPILLRIVK